MIKESCQGAVTILTVDTPLNGETGPTLVDRVVKLPRGGRPQVVLDLATVPLLDSLGCEALLDTHDLLAEVGGDAKLAGPAPLVRDILNATGVADAFEVLDTVNEAIAAFAK